MIKVIYAMVNNEMPEDFVDDLFFAEGEYEIMLFDSPIIAEVNGEMQEFPEYHCILYKPGQHIHYRAKSGKLLYTWIRFNCDEALFTEGYIPFGVPVFCPDFGCYREYFIDVANENYWNHDSRQLVLEALMHIIFHRLHDYAFLNTDLSQYRERLIDLRNNIYAHPEFDWTLEYMAEYVNLSVRALQKQYKAFAHISCMNEVIESRLEHSKVLLNRTSDSIQEISFACGYRNVEHFCRQFKQHENMTPNQYRKEHRSL